MLNDFYGYILLILVCLCFALIAEKIYDYFKLRDLKNLLDKGPRHG